MMMFLLLFRYLFMRQRQRIASSLVLEGIISKRDLVSPNLICQSLFLCARASLVYCIGF